MVAISRFSYITIYIVIYEALPIWMWNVDSIVAELIITAGCILIRLLKHESGKQEILGSMLMACSLFPKQYFECNLWKNFLLCWGLIPCENESFD